MQLNKRTLEELRNIINGDGTPDYRSGPKLVAFFNDLGFSDTYGHGFPSRWAYTDDRLQQINGTPEFDKCIRNAFSVVNYIGRIAELDALIARFNQYLAFDKWKIVRNNDELSFIKLDRVIIDDDNSSSNMTEREFLKKTFTVDVASLKLDPHISGVITERLKEIEGCVQNGAPLASVILIGSVMEGMLLGTALTYPQKFNQAQCSPKEKDGNKPKTLQFQNWTLNNFIDVAAEIGILKQDVRKFSHVVRDFRNYIHPYEQMASGFLPDKQTALICFQVLKAAMNQIGDFQKNATG